MIILFTPTVLANDGVNQAAMALSIRISNSLGGSDPPTFTEERYSFVISEDVMISHLDTYVGMVKVENEDSMVNYQITGGKPIRCVVVYHRIITTSTFKHHLCCCSLNTFSYCIYHIHKVWPHLEGTSLSRI